MNNSTKKDKLYTIRKLNNISKHSAKFYLGLLTLFRYMSVVKANKKKSQVLSAFMLVQSMTHIKKKSLK